MTKQDKIILTDLYQVLKTNLGDLIKDVILFGSRAKGTAQPDSDYDILLILTRLVDWRKQRDISYLCYDIGLKYDIFTDVHMLSEPELGTLRAKQPIFTEAIAKGIYIS